MTEGTKPTADNGIDRRSMVVHGVQLLTILTPLAGGLFALLKYLDLRNRELRTERYKTYADLVRTMSGLKPDGTRAFLVEEIQAVYQLEEFDEYRDISIAILEASMRQPEWNQAMGEYARKVLADLKK
jgi:hypothetical protein